MKIILSIGCLFIIANTYAQTPKRFLKKIGNNPVFYIDSLNVEQSEFMRLNPKEVAGVTIFKGKEAIELMGEDGKDGVIYIETIKFAKTRYWRYFKSKSPEYLKVVPDVQNDSNVQYILNEKILTNNFEGDLSSINDKIFKRIIILTKEELIKKYKIEDKDFGIEIFSDVPKNVYHANRRF